MKLQQLIENHWYKTNNLFLSLLLLPLSSLFFILSQIRFYLYRFKLLKSHKLPIPVVIVGNISVGGAGKTPLTKYLVQELTSQGIAVGVILRGYKGKSTVPRIVNQNDDSELVGDEALIYATNNIRVAIGSDRYQAGLILLKHYPDLDLIIADDGLQHYRLQRDYEIAVIDSNRMLGNQFVLPMGPLRETINRLKSVTAIVINGQLCSKQQALLPAINTLTIQTLVLDKIYNPLTGEEASSSTFHQQQLVAIAAIGDPNRFFSFLTNNGIQLTRTIAFPDHYCYQASDIPDKYDAILVTEKDYVKLAKLNNAKIWVVLVKAQLDKSTLVTQICQLIHHIVA
jgi:tetraacyldisaccharide 4'-kinase